MPAAFQWTEDQLRDMVTSYQQGEPAQYIAKRYGTSHQVILPVLLKQGVKLRSPRERRYGRTSNTFNASYFHSIDTEEKAYWLGFLTADGCVTGGKNPGDSPRVTLHLGIQDYGHLIKFKQALQATQTISKNARSCSFTIFSSELVADLAVHGIVPKKTFSTKPARVTPDLERHYWRGVIDGDGYISQSKEITLVGDHEVVLAFQAFVLARFPMVKASIFLKEQIYTFRVTGQPARTMLDVFYGDATVYLDRKYLPVEDRVRANLYGNQGSQAPRKQETLSS